MRILFISALPLLVAAASVLPRDQCSPPNPLLCCQSLVQVDMTPYLQTLLESLLIQVPGDTIAGLHCRAPTVTTPDGPASCSDNEQLAFCTRIFQDGLIAIGCEHCPA